MFDSEWKLRLFLSVDLVGSTAYKAAESRSDAPEWSHTFREFFRDFPSVIEGEAAELAPPYPECNDALHAWKFSGDEILFWVKLTTFTETVTHLAAFKRAMVAYRERWKAKRVPLNLKATAWLAGFPVTNSEIRITHDGGDTLDFIGPSIDTGFRLTKYATPRKFVLSADLALMLLDAIYKTEVPWENFHLLYDGTEALKGVMNGEPYPLVWLDVRDGRQEVEEQLLGISRVALPHVLRHYLSGFVSEQAIRPFIDGDASGPYGTVPDALRKKRDRMKEMELQVTEVGSEFDAGPDGEPTIPDPVFGKEQGFLPGVPGN